MSQLFLFNIPWHCQEPELRLWIESKGYSVDSIKVIRDLVAHASPSFAYVTLLENTQTADAVRALNGQTLMDRVLQVKEDWRSHDVKLTNTENMKS